MDVTRYASTSYACLDAVIRYGSEIRACLGEIKTGGSLVAVIARKRIQNIFRILRRKVHASIVERLCFLPTDSFHHSF
jgi:hypothetical protein